MLCGAAWDGFLVAVPGGGALLLAAHTHYPSHIHQLSLHHPQSDQKRSPAPSAAFPAQRSCAEVTPPGITILCHISFSCQDKGNCRRVSLRQCCSSDYVAPWVEGDGAPHLLSLLCSHTRARSGQAGRQTATQDRGSHLQRPFGQLAGPRGGWSWQRGDSATCRSQRDIAAATGEPPVVSTKPRVRVCHRDVSKTLQMLPRAAAQTLGEAPWDLVSAAGRVRSCLAPCQSLQGPWGGGLGGLGAPRPSEGTRAVPASGVPQRHRASCLCSPTTP